MKFLTKLLFFLALPSLLFAQTEEVFFAYRPCLSPDASTIIFSHDQDLWSVGVQGGLAKRLTAMDGNETAPKISPDGKWLAFTSTQYGNQDVYIMPIDGGNATQLTFHESADVVSSWSWDSKEIYFTSGRYNRMSTYSVSIEGGTPKRLFPHYFNNVHNVALHPDGRIFFNETWESSNFEHRKRYKGAYNPDIKSYNPKTKAYKVLTDYDGKDFGVTIDKKGKIYFISDEFNGEYNLYTFERGKKKQLTKFETSTRYPNVSANGEKIVFQKDYQLFVYDVKKGNAKQVKIEVLNNNTLSKSQDFDVKGNISGFDVSDDGKKLCFVSRGELFVSDAKGKFVRQIKTNPLGRVMECYFLKDNKTIIFNQTVNGYQNWFTIPANGKGKEQQHTSDLANNRNIAFNSDRTKAVYFSGREEVKLMDLESFSSETILKEELWGFYNDLPKFAPGDKHILFSAYRNFEQEIFLYDLESKKKHNLTNTGVNETGAFFSPDGKYLYFNSNRTQPSYPYGMRDAKIYRMAMQRFDEPYKMDEFDELFAEEEKKDTTEKEEDKKEDKEEKEEDKIKLDIEFEGLMDRLERIGPRFGAQSGPYIVQKDDKTIVLYASNHDEGKYALWKTTYEPFESPKTEKIKGAETGSLNIEEGDGSYFWLSRGNLYTLDVNGGKVDKIDISYTFRRQLKAEFEQMFYETWANMEENFYNEDFHGVNWTAMREQYEAYLPHTNNRADLRRILNDMLGELNTSHFGFRSSGKEEKLFYGTRTLALGLLFDENEPYRVKHIVKEGPADKKDKDIQPGDRITKVNGEAINTSRNREYYFAKPSLDKEVVLTLDRYGKEVEVKLHPVSYFGMRGLLYDEWMDSRQAVVDKKSGNRIAYVHMKNMGGGQLQHFKEEMVSEAHAKDALILDLRYNTGGNVHDAVLQFLSQQPYLQWKYREGELTKQPNFYPAAKPILLLINEQSLSDAEMTAQGFKSLKLGTIIGTETYRWIIFTSGKGLVDGSFYRLPSWGCYTLDGKNLEKTGVAPDITVKNTFLDRLTDKDPQLDRAIQEILKELK